jgi:tRNA uridine 5-carbamoylmethylation protein Kti12
MAQQIQTGSSELALSIALPDNETLATTLALPPNQTTTLAQLQRLRRQFITLNKQTTGELGIRQIASSFVDYIEGAVK